MRNRIAALVLLAALVTEPAAAGESSRLEGVVELFTSQGCSSCPPADAVLGELIGEGRILALAYHVDYWNYRGWRDTLSSPENTARQKAYAHMLDRKSVYTPQAILNGRTHENGADRVAIDRELAAMAGDGRGLVVDLSVTRSDDTLTIEVGPGRLPVNAGGKIAKANLVFVVFDRENVVDVARGENSGRVLAYRHSVRSLQTVGMWKGRAMSLDLPASLVEDWSERNCAVLLQTMAGRGVPGAIIGAALLGE